MPSPFPGMDPFIESQKWTGFQHSIISEIRNMLTPQVRPRYVVDVEEDVYLATEGGTPVKIVIPEVSVVHGTGWMEDDAGSVVTAIEPAIVTLPMSEPVAIAYLAIRRSDNEESVAVIEILSTTNKSPRDGRSEYLAKRNSLLRSRAHLIEIDLLRGGEPLSAGDPDVSLDLQSVFATTYDRAGYDYAIHYDRSIEPPLDERRFELVKRSLSALQTGGKP